MRKGSFKSGLLIILALLVFISCKNEKNSEDDYDTSTVNFEPVSDKKKRRLDDQKTTFFSTQLELTPEESQKFWPVYNEFQKKHELLIKAHQEKYTIDIRNLDDLSDKEAEEFADSQILLSNKLADLKANYHKKLKSILPAKKILLLYELEKDFKKILLIKAKEKRQNKKKKQ